MAHQWKLWVTPSGSGDVVITAPGGRSCAENGALCTEAGQSLSHGLSATIRGPGDESDPETGEQSGSDLPGPPNDLRAVYTHWSGSRHIVSWRSPSSFGTSASKYHVLGGGCERISGLTVDASWSGTYKILIDWGGEGVKFGVEGVNRNGTGPCVEVASVLLKPDLVARSPSVNPSSLATGQAFTLSVTVGNDGDSNAPWRPTLLYFRSTDGTIRLDDTEEDGGRTDSEKEIGALFIGDTRSHSINLTAPSAAGTYYYGACLKPGTATSEFESDITNNCSESVAVVVSD